MVMVEADGVTRAADQSPIQYGNEIRARMIAGATIPVTPPGLPNVKVTIRTPPAIVGRGSIEAVLDSEIQRVAAKALQAAAPDHPWDATDPAVPMMEAAWIDARHAYEHVEGATAPVVPDIDISIDGRVEDFGPGTGTGTLTATSDMFTADGMSGLHAVERVLYASVTPLAVVTYEDGLGYAPPQAYPKTQQDVSEMNDAAVLCGLPTFTE
jgi:hypothetical protein